MVRGAAAGKYQIKPCGKAHAWCRVCQPEQAARQRKPKPPRKEYERPCRNCGRCDVCLGLTAPEGMKVCRKCGQTKILNEFSRRNDTGGYRNQCYECLLAGHGLTVSFICAACARRSTRLRTADYTLCPRCRVYMVRPCKYCGQLFKPQPTGGPVKQYCSDECRQEAMHQYRIQQWRTHRLKILQAYGGDPPRCVCCGESILAFLALDHINGGGGKHRQETGGGGFYVWLAKNNYPEGFQVLCHNCNQGRRMNDGVCPHKSKS